MGKRRQKAASIGRCSGYVRTEGDSQEGEALAVIVEQNKEKEIQKMSANGDTSPEDREYAARLLRVAQQERDELPAGDTESVAYIVLSALLELLEDAANGYVTLTGLPVAIREGLEREELMTPPQRRLVGLDEESERQRRAIYQRYLRMIEERPADHGSNMSKGSCGELPG